MACCSSERRMNLLNNLKCLVDNMDDCCMPSNGPCLPPPCPPASCCPPIIEMYDPCPKPAIPLACPAPMTPLDPEIPVPHVACPNNPGGGVVIPIVSPPPVPCIPLAAACGSGMEQPCVACNPPPMMVCFKKGPSRRGGSGGGRGGGCGGGKVQGPVLTIGGPCALRACRSRELRMGILQHGCNCIKRNGLQDQCPRFQCQGRPECLTDPVGCCPGQFNKIRIAEGLDLYERMYPPKGGHGCGGSYGSGGGGGYSADGSMKAEYLCYPAYFKMPPCSPNCCTPCSPFGGPSPCSPLTPPSQGPCKSVQQCCPMPQCTPPVPTIPLPPCPPITIPSPPQIIQSPIPVPVPTPLFPMCPCPPTNSPC